MVRILARQALLPVGWARDVSVMIGDDGRIEAVGTDAGAASAGHDHRVDLLLPAPANLHSHAFQRALAGLTERRGPDPRDSFWSWRRLMYRFLERLDPDQVEAIAALVFMEMLEAGYGAVAEFHYLHHGPDGTPYDGIAEMAARITAAAERAGIGLTLLPVLYGRGGCDGRPLDGAQRRFGNDPDRFAALHAASRQVIKRAPPDAALGVAPHSLRAVDPDALRAAVGLDGVRVIHMHLAEQEAEVAEVLAHRGARPIEWLLGNHAVDDRWCLIHCTQMTDHESRALAASRAVAGVCPITEANLGDGIFAGVGFAAHGGRYGVGTDSNVQVTLFEELCALEYSQRLRDRSRAVLATAERSTGRVLFETAAAGGAQAAGRESGAIEAGRWADLIGLVTDNPWVCGRAGDAALDSLMVTGRGRDCVTDVWSAGRHMVRAGRHVARDGIAADFKQVMADLGADL